MSVTNLSPRLPALAAGLLLTVQVAIGEETREGIDAAYVSGGVGESSREELTAAQGQYSLKLVFAYTSGSYLAKVQVDIADADGKTVLSTISEGPWLLIALPAGRYEVAATTDGETKSSTVEVPVEGLKTINMLWKPPA